MLAGASPRQRLAFALWELADLIQADERRRSFRSRAYRQAVWSLDDLAPGLDDTADDMLSVPGIGPGVVRLIETFRFGDRLPELEALRARYPRQAARLRHLPRMTPVIQQSLKAEVGVETTDDLMRAIETGDATGVKGVGEVTVELWHGVLSLWPAEPAIPAHDAWVLATRFRDHFAAKLAAEAHVAGEARRVTEWVSRLVLVIVSEPSDDAFRLLEASAMGVVTGKSAEGMSLLTPPGTPMDVRLCARREVGTAMIGATGPSPHVATLDLTRLRASEEEVYVDNGRAWVPPAARDNLDPPPDDLILPERIKGDLHVHSLSSPDGRMSLDTIVAGMLARGLEYAVVTDHTIGLRFGGLDAEGLRRQSSEIAAARARHPEFQLLHGAEVNIGPEGDLDIDDETLASLDLVVAGVHSRFDLPGDEQTERVVAALGHPAVRVLAHPTGRRIGRRPGIEIDLDRVIRVARENLVALEVNGHRDRLDLPSDAAASASSAGVLLAANSDAHRPGELANVGNAVSVLQRAHVPRSQVVNAMSWEEFSSWLDTRGSP